MIEEEVELREKTIADVEAAKSTEAINVSSSQINEVEILDNYINNEDNKKQALLLASEILNMMKKNWFTCTAYSRKSRFDLNTAYNKLKTLELFGFAKMKMGIFADGKENKGIPMFKIVIDKQHRIDAINDIIAYHEDQIRILKNELPRD